MSPRIALRVTSMLLSAAEVRAILRGAGGEGPDSLGFRPALLRGTPLLSGLGNPEYLGRPTWERLNRADEVTWERSGLSHARKADPALRARDTQFGGQEAGPTNLRLGLVLLDEPRPATPADLRGWFDARCPGLLELAQGRATVMVTLGEDQAHVCLQLRCLLFSAIHHTGAPELAGGLMVGVRSALSELVLEMDREARD